MTSGIPRPLRIIDIGGTENFWVQMGTAELLEAGITIVNIESEPRGDLTGYDNIDFINGDARDEEVYNNGEYDVIFSNSVIEHIPDKNGQRKMAELIRKYGSKYFIQTPARSILIEPHFLFPFFQFLPKRAKIFLVMHYNMGWFRKCATKAEAIELVGSIRLLSKKEMKQLFPEAEILTERFLGFPKSYIAMRK